MATTNLHLLKNRLKRLQQKLTRQVPGSSNSAKTEVLIQKTELRIKQVEALNRVKRLETTMRSLEAEIRIEDLTRNGSTP